MILTSREMAQVCGMSRFGFQKLARQLNIPFTKKRNKFLFDTNNSKFQDFFLSIEMAQNLKLQVLYSLADLAKLRKQHRNTIRTFLIEHDIKTYRSGRKLIILLVDLHRFQQLIANSSN